MIEREILVNAPVDVVWKVITEPGQVAQWFCDEAEFEARPGAGGSLSFGAKATNRPVTVRLRVEIAQPPRRFAFRWDHPAGEEPRPGNSLLVEFTLTAEGDGTRLRLVESGFVALERPDDEKSGYLEAHETGWDAHLGNLRAHVSVRG